MKVVQYRGYELSVPASWPVYQLARDPDQCIRYDMHAVYLGTPGVNQICPPGLVGRTETVSIGGPAFQGKSSAVVVQRVPLAGQPAVILQDVRQHELAMTLSTGSAPALTATYGSDPGLAQQVLASVHQMVSQRARRADPEPKPPATKVPATPQSSPSPTGSAGTAGSPSPAASPPFTLTGPLAGFDTCTAPSLATMAAWRAKFAATAIYIGGEESACDYGNLTPKWIKAVEAMGWSLLPTYVGLQAPCGTFSANVSHTVATAEAQGKTDAEWAVEDAHSFGLGKGTPIYDDMEAYNTTKPACVEAVLTFLDAWTREIDSQGYVSGVYSSAGSGILDLDTTSTINGHPLAEPQSLWFALWDNDSDLNGSPYLTEDLWPPSRLSKQYLGTGWVTVGHTTLDVDLDLVNSATVR